jgi:two-component system, OmpR family, response regulator TctD
MIMRFVSVKWLSGGIGESANVLPMVLPMSNHTKLLLVEDDASMQVALQRALGKRGMDVIACADGRQALDKWMSSQPDVVVLDLTLPGMDGLQVLEQARRQGLATPVLILTARGTVGDRIIGLNTGADDYLPKPFDLDELEARLRALSRRRSSSAEKESASAPQQVGNLRYDRESGAFYHHDAVMELTPRELALLQALIAKLGQAVSKERLFELVFPGEVDVQYEAVEVVVYRLRKKLAHTGVTLVTLRGLGYLLKADT